MLNEKLKQRDFLPVVKMNDGSLVKKENWHKRRKEMKNLLEENLYGAMPPAPFVCLEAIPEIPSHYHTLKLF